MPLWCYYYVKMKGRTEERKGRNKRRRGVKKKWKKNNNLLLLSCCVYSSFCLSTYFCCFIFTHSTLLTTILPNNKNIVILYLDTVRYTSCNVNYENSKFNCSMHKFIVSFFLHFIRNEVSSKIIAVRCGVFLIIIRVYRYWYNNSLIKPAMYGW